MKGKTRLLSLFVIIILQFLLLTVPSFAGTTTLSGPFNAAVTVFAECGKDVPYVVLGPYEPTIAGTYAYQDHWFSEDIVIYIYDQPVDLGNLSANRIANFDDDGNINLNTGQGYYILVIPFCEYGTFNPNGTFQFAVDGPGDLVTFTPPPPPPPPPGTSVQNVSPAESTGPFVDPSTIPPDDRLNYGKGDVTNGIVYARTNNGITIYGINEFGEGFLGANVPFDELPNCDPAPSENQLLASSADGKYSIWLLTTCEYQVNMGPDAEGKVQVIIWQGIPMDKDSVTYYEFNVFDILGG